MEGVRRDREDAPRDQAKGSGFCLARDKTRLYAARRLAKGSWKMLMPYYHYCFPDRRSMEEYYKKYFRRPRNY